jgi:hypothetical protein
MVDYPKEEMFREFVVAMTANKTISFLDISKVSLPYEAGQETCAALGVMFAKNSTLKELDISGEQAVLESARYGRSKRLVVLFADTLRKFGGRTDQCPLPIV